MGQDEFINTETLEDLRRHFPTITLSKDKVN